MKFGCLLDTNILLRLLWLNDPNSFVVQRAVSSMLLEGRPLFFTLQNASEFWNTCTRPVDANGLALSPQKALAGLTAIESRASLLLENPRVYDEWKHLVSSYGITGKQAHDAKLVAFMHTHEIQQILTMNVRHFSRYPSIDAISPDQFA